MDSKINKQMGRDMTKYTTFHSSFHKTSVYMTILHNTVRQHSYPSLHPPPICMNFHVSFHRSLCLAPVTQTIHLSMPDFWEFNQLCPSSNSKMCVKGKVTWKIWAAPTRQAHTHTHSSSVLQPWAEHKHSFLYLVGKFRGLRLRYKVKGWDLLFFHCLNKRALWKS